MDTSAVEIAFSSLSLALDNLKVMPDDLSEYSAEPLAEQTSSDMSDLAGLTVDRSLVDAAAGAAFRFAQATAHFHVCFPGCFYVEAGQAYTRAIADFVMDPADVCWAEVTSEIGELIEEIGGSGQEPACFVLDGMD